MDRVTACPAENIKIRYLQPQSKSFQQASFWVLAMFATDFLRIAWIITPFDFIAIKYLSDQFRGGRLNAQMLKISFWTALPFLIVVCCSGIINPQYGFEHIVLVAGVAMSVLKALAFITATKQYDGNRLIPINTGFLVLNIACFLAFMAGHGFSWSGRFSGVFGQSNGMGSFEMFSFVIAILGIFNSPTKCFVINSGLSFFLLLTTGSRGSLLAVVIMLLFCLRKFLMRKLVLFTMGSVLFLVIFFVVMSDDSNHFLLDVSQILQETGVPGIERISSFIEALHYGEADDAYDDARGHLNNAAISYIWNCPSVFGGGYESSPEILNYQCRVHQIFLNMGVELGLAGMLCFLFYFIFGLYKYVFSSRTKRKDGLYELLFIGVWLQASKTPFFFLNAVSWSVIIEALIPECAKDSD